MSRPCLQTPTQALFGLNIMAVNFAQAVDLLTRAGNVYSAPARVVVTPNVDHIVKLEHKPDLKDLYGKADYIFADGMPVVWASRLLGKPLPERVTGADLFVAMCHQAIELKWRVVLLGGRPGGEDELKSRFQTSFPGLNIEIISPSMRFDPLGEEGHQAAEQIRALAPNLVFVCLGLPKQERWALHHAALLPGGVLMCVGAAMEFALGLQSRAPMRVQRLGLEWLWRLLSNPRHLWRRYLVDDPYFLVLCWREWRAARALKQERT
ncbi:WecB/TagA/CpsF family glycosyltransferase [Pusillimonas sp. CC-YST705]|uniref:WecB/TagA/CpsF family glycosyltransferase n=1 Tax=Mesopusillimonas faecipullorum TaxID=2755040 RepID=A0ABS8CET6_9BURK|nr:WecB/TagA/CpsF family glycosyltransferase [Mesopusillimonas faecipullorum]MCB5364559.1 WecB/TagA/CpsF family glycosyltransferase [Mesopusillimonas faecipullorum]